MNRTCQLCGATFEQEVVRCPLCGDVMDREAMKRSCIHCGRLLMGDEYAEAIDTGGWLTGDLVCRDCRRKPAGPAILKAPEKQPTSIAG